MREAADLVGRVHRRVVEESVGRSSPLDPGDLRRIIRFEAPLASVDEVEDLVAAVVRRRDGLGPLDALLDDAGISEIMVNGPGPVWVERFGRLERSGVVVDGPTVELVIARILGPLGLRVDRSAPLVDARLPDGSRVHIAVPPLAVDGPCLTIRRFAERTFPVDAFCDAAVAALLRASVPAGINTVVTGGTGSGKTSLLNALAREIPDGERVITIEDAAELRLDHEHVVRLEARPANVEGVGEVTIRTLVRNALRMRPDRLVVGEVRGGEALDMVQAMNTGHDGTLSTCHANGPVDALRRLETLVLMGEVDLPASVVRDQIARGVGLVVAVARGQRGERRVVAAVRPCDEEVLLVDGGSITAAGRAITADWGSR